MLACQYGSPAILNYLIEQVIPKSENPELIKRKILGEDLPLDKKAKGGVHAVHIAGLLGNLEILRILHFKFNANFDVRTDRGLTLLHCAAQRAQGIVTIYFLADIMENFDPNILDKQGASPLHYAIMAIEENNIQALLSLGADINLQDRQGDSMLHVALARYVDDQDNFGVYKEIIKEILQYGAARDLRNKDGLTAEDLIKTYKSRIKLQEYQDYINNGIDVEDER
jgi:hypothetical protein